MSFSLRSGRTFEETIETLFNHMGYDTKPKTVLHTRSAHIQAIIRNPRGKKRVLIECINGCDPVGIQEIQQFCNRVAHAREKSEADTGMMISVTGFNDEAITWCAKNCSFVQLKTYSQVITKTSKVRKLMRKFNTETPQLS